nr:hypothetical protein [Tanacetum cinerariifolium]
NPYKAIRQACLVRTNAESEPFEDPVETELPHTVAPPTCHVEESEGSGKSDARSMLSDFTAPLLPDHPLTHTTPVLVPSLCRTTRMIVRVPPAMSPSFSVSIAEVAAMPDLAFCKRFRSSYDSSPSPTFPIWKRYRGDEGPITGDEDLCLGVKSLGLGGDEAVPESQQQVSPVLETTVGQSSRFVLEPERPERVSTVRQPTLTTWIDSKDGIAYIDVPAYPPPAPPVQTPLSPEWSSGLLFIFLATSIIPSPISSPVISLTVPSLVASPATEELSPALFERSLEHEQERVAVTFGAVWRLVLALKSWQLAEKRHAWLNLAEIVDSMRRGQEPEEMYRIYEVWISSLYISLN